MRKRHDDTTAIEAFLAKKAEIDAMLARLRRRARGDGVMSPLTRADIARIREGAMVITANDTAHGLPLPDARWSAARRVVEVFARRDDTAGKAFVCFYTEFSANARISGSAKEGEAHLRIVADAP